VSESARLADEAMEVFLHARNQIEFFEGALDVLGHLDSSHRLGALSNGNADVHRLGLSHLFDFAFSAEDVGAPKPDLALFQHALNHTGVAADRMVYVGDDPILDVDAAKQAGLKTVWLDHGKKPKGSTRPDATISHIRELPEAIRAISRGSSG
jgi:putative hydrolase of the HAD superfamily